MATVMVSFVTQKFLTNNKPKMLLAPNVAWKAETYTDIHNDKMTSWKNKTVLRKLNQPEPVLGSHWWKGKHTPHLLVSWFLFFSLFFFLSVSFVLFSFPLCLYLSHLLAHANSLSFKHPQKLSVTVLVTLVSDSRPVV